LQAQQDAENIAEGLALVHSQREDQLLAQLAAERAQCAQLKEEIASKDAESEAKATQLAAQLEATQAEKAAQLEATKAETAALSAELAAQQQAAQAVAVGNRSIDAHAT
jgi:hypothetical protein